MVSLLAERLAEIRGRIEEAARRTGRTSSAVRLMAVTKGFPRETALEAMEALKALQAGPPLLGENRVQEAEAKFEGLEDRCELHLIGHLQTNKARVAARLFRCVQSIDSLHTAEALHARCVEAGRAVEVLLELNTSGEASKSGFPSVEEMRAVLEEMDRLPTLRPRGLMTVGPLTDDPRRIRASFGQLRSAFDGLRAGRTGFDVLSMGMSSDFLIAIEEGATLVRLGTALFGPRPGR